MGAAGNDKKRSSTDNEVASHSETFHSDTSSEKELDESKAHKPDVTSAGNAIQSSSLKDKSETLEKERCDDNSIFKAPEKNPKNKNIFTEEGAKRVQKSSEFLQKSYVEPAPAPTPIKQSYDFSSPCTLYYEENTEWLTLGEGCVHLIEDRFVFVRKALQTTLLNLKYSPLKFNQEDADIFFVTPTKKSLGTGFEMIERRYKMSFKGKEEANSFMNNVSNNGEN